MPSAPAWQPDRRLWCPTVPRSRLVQDPRGSIGEGEIRQKLIEAAAEDPHTLKDPAPSVFFVEFGSSSINFELVAWSNEMSHRPRRYRSDLNFAIDRKLREAGIEIPFPQRELSIRSGLLKIEHVPAEPEKGRAQSAS